MKKVLILLTLTLFFISGCSNDIDCSSNSYNCGDFKTQEKAQEVFEECGGMDNDIHSLDRNNDGIVCESLD